jgi:hypothetical protein
MRGTILHATKVPTFLLMYSYCGTALFKKSKDDPIQGRVEQRATNAEKKYT